MLLKSIKKVDEAKSNNTGNGIIFPLFWISRSNNLCNYKYVKMKYGITSIIKLIFYLPKYIPFHENI